MSSQNKLPEQPDKAGFVEELEIDRLRKDVFRSDKEKFQLFVQMLRANKMYSRMKITHK